MLGRQALTSVARAASELERVVMAAKAAKLRGWRLAKEAKDKKAAGMSPAEKSHARGNSRAERVKHTPSV